MCSCTEKPRPAPELVSAPEPATSAASEPASEPATSAASEPASEPAPELASRPVRHAELGQATVEAAVVLPVLLAIFGLLLEPVVLLYDRAVMQAAASEACRAVATQTADDAAIEAFVLRRLAAVPQKGIFHVGANDGWEIEVTGGELSDAVAVTITHEVDTLPLWGVAAGLSAHMTSGGRCEQTVLATSALQPTWATDLDDGPDDWIGEWQ